jgi:putative membrane protein
MELSVQLQGMLSFLIYFGSAVFMTCLFAFVYALITPYREFELIRAGNKAAAYSLGGAMLGFAIPLASAIVHSVGFVDMLMWSIVAFVVQVLVFRASLLVLKGLANGIREGVESNGLFLGMMSVVAGILNAASMSY